MRDEHALLTADAGGDNRSALHERGIPALIADSGTTQEDERIAQLGGPRHVRATAWFALQFGPSKFGVFDAFADEAARQAHLQGPSAAALMAGTTTLLSEAQKIEKAHLLSAKLPG